MRTMCSFSPLVRLHTWNIWEAAHFASCVYWRPTVIFTSTAKIQMKAQFSLRLCGRVKHMNPGVLKESWPLLLTRVTWYSCVRFVSFLRNSGKRPWLSQNMTFTVLFLFVAGLNAHLSILSLQVLFRLLNDWTFITVFRWSGYTLVIPLTSFYVFLSS